MKHEIFDGSSKAILEFFKIHSLVKDTLESVFSDDSLMSLVIEIASLKDSNLGKNRAAGVDNLRKNLFNSFSSFIIDKDLVGFTPDDYEREVEFLVDFNKGTLALVHAGVDVFNPIGLDRVSLDKLKELLGYLDDTAVLYNKYFGKARVALGKNVFTGFKDSYGDDIYLGDLVTDEGEKGHDSAWYGEVIYLKEDNKFCVSWKGEGISESLSYLVKCEHIAKLPSSFSLEGITEYED